jgi:hypothetical protein
MKNLMIVFFVLVIGLSSCATPLPSTQTATLPQPTNTPTPLPPTQTPTLPPVCQSLESKETPSELSGKEVVSEMIEKLHVGDVTGAMSYFADDARVYIIGVPPVGFEEIRGKEAICRLWVDYVSDNLEWEITILSAYNSPNGVFITSKSKIWLDFYRQVGAAPNEFFDNIVVKDGKIIEYSSILKEESLAKLRSVFTDVFPSPEPATDTSSVIPGSEFSIIFSDFACTYEGPAAWKSGTLNINGEVKDDQVYALVFVHVDEGKDFFDLAVASGGHVPYWAKYTLFDFGPAESNTVQHAVGGNLMYLMCFAEKMTTTPIGLFGPFEIRP